jgi:hypothetical protein
MKLRKNGFAYESCQKGGRPHFSFDFSVAAEITLSALTLNIQKY